MTEHLDKLPFEDYCKTIFNKDALFDKPESLNGYRVLSCTQYILGPCAAAYLGELGAEVIKIEVPRLGEPMRHCSPYNETWFYPVSRWNPGRGTSPAFQGANHNEYFVTLDYRKPEAKEIFYNMVQKSDAMVWNYRPGTFDRWKIGYGACKEVNPRIVLAWCGGFGGFGPGRNWASYDILGQAKGGVFSFTGHRAGRAVCRLPQQAHHLDHGLLRGHAGLHRHAGRPLLAGHGLGPGQLLRVLPGARLHPLHRIRPAPVGPQRRRADALGQLGHRNLRQRHLRLRPLLPPPFGPPGGEGRGLHLRPGLYGRRFRQADEPHRPPRPGQKVRTPTTIASKPRPRKRSIRPSRSS